MRRSFKERPNGRKYGELMQYGGAQLTRKCLYETACLNLGLYMQMLPRLNAESGTGKEDEFASCATEELM